MNRISYKFVGSWGGNLYWQSTQPLVGDSRVEQIRCNRDWFYATAVAKCVGLDELEIRYRKEMAA